MNEDDFWRDFFNGRSLEKYKVKTVNKFFADRWQIEEVYYPKEKKCEKTLQK
jgi:hypothetical protein